MLSCDVPHWLLANPIFYQLIHIAYEVELQSECVQICNR